MTKWYYAKNGQRHGPVAADQLRDLAATGTLLPKDLVWKEGCQTWIPAKTVEGLFQQQPLDLAWEPASLRKTLSSLSRWLEGATTVSRSRKFGWSLWGVMLVVLLLTMPLRGPADTSLFFAVSFSLLGCLFFGVFAALPAWLVLDVEALRLTAQPIVPAGAKWFATSAKGLGEARMAFSPVWAISLGFAVVWVLAANFGEAILGIHRFFFGWGAVALLPLVHLTADRPRVLRAISQHARDQAVAWKSLSEVFKRPRVIVALILIWIPSLLGIASCILLLLLSLSKAISGS